MRKLTELLDEYNRASGPYKLNPPIDEAELSRYLTELAPFQLSSELLELYRWHNGGNGQSFFSVEEAYSFSSLDEAIKDRAFMAQLHSEDEDYAPWPNAMLPIGKNDCGSLCAILSRAPVEASPLFEYPIADGDCCFYLLHKDLRSMMMTYFTNETRIASEKSALKKFKSDHKIKMENKIYEECARQFTPERYDYDTQGDSQFRNGRRNVYDISCREDFPDEWFEPPTLGKK